MKKDEILEFIKSCDDQETLYELKEVIWKKQINIIDNSDKDIIDKIFEVTALKRTSRISCWLPLNEEDKDKETAQELVDFVDAYLLPRREGVVFYNDILTSLRDNYKIDGGVRFDDGSEMTEDQYNSIIKYIYNKVKSGEIGFEWKW